MTKFELFEQELIALCEKYKVTLSSSGYDWITVSNYEDWAGFIYCGIEDCTNEDETTRQSRSPT